MFYTRKNVRFHEKKKRIRMIGREESGKDLAAEVSTKRFEKTMSRTVKVQKRSLRSNVKSEFSF